ncbi:unnamed protein product [Owenia fusiformis]|uniref:3CxxC-type domain-containing protein n=1 Tax=Owenia fusiformis TaxID=6347 RepID=A0A8S4NDD2_OWEFU|nr:unnamed protein product [Owenia fusiformis]
MGRRKFFEPVDYNRIIREVMASFDPPYCPQEDIIKEFAKQGVYGKSYLRCKSCGKGWTSAFGWVVIDLRRQKTGKFFKQGCENCAAKTGPFFPKEIFEAMVEIALWKYEYFYYSKEPGDRKPGDGSPPELDIDDLPENEGGPHKVSLCDRCIFKRRRCWEHQIQPRVDNDGYINEDEKEKLLEKHLKHGADDNVPGLNIDHAKKQRKKRRRKRGGRKSRAKREEEQAKGTEAEQNDGNKGQNVTPSRNDNEP